MTRTTPSSTSAKSLGSGSFRNGKSSPARSGQSQQDHAYRRMIAVCDRVADAALQGADADELTRTFAAVVNKTVVLLDSDFTLRTHSVAEHHGTPALRWNPKDAGTRRLLRALAADHRPLRVPAVPGSAIAHGCLAIPIAVGDTKLGYLLVLDDAETAGPDDADLLVASYTATLFALTLAHEKANTDLGLRYQSAVVDALVSGHFLDADDAQQKARTLGLADGQPYRVAALRLVTGDRTSGALRPLDVGINDDVISALTACVPGAAAVARGPSVVMIIPDRQVAGQPRQAHQQAAAVLARFTALLRARAITATPTCGLSDPTKRSDHAPRQLEQADYAINLGLRLGRTGQVISYEGLGIYRLLLQIGDMQQLWKFAADVLGPLLEYEATHKLELVRTLSVYLSEHESLKQAARRLKVHANTISYRIQRIEELTPLDLSNPDDRLVAHVAIKIVESQQGLDRGTSQRA